MGLKQMLRKISGGRINQVFLFFGRDRLTLAKVKKRRDLVTIGTKYGGWVIPETLFDSSSICYCVGCGEDISFDIGLVDKFECDVFAFDPTPRAVEYVGKVAGHNPRYHFFDLGLWDKEDNLRFYVPKNQNHVSHSLLNLQKTKNYIYVNVKRLKSIIENIGHNKIDLIKLDIEGAEYRVIDSIIEDNIDVKVICVEYDECSNPLDDKYKQRIRESVNRLLAIGYEMVCAQGGGNYTFVKKNTK